MVMSMKICSRRRRRKGMAEMSWFQICVRNEGWLELMWWQGGNRVWWRWSGVQMPTRWEGGNGVWRQGRVSVWQWCGTNMRRWG